MSINPMYSQPLPSAHSMERRKSQALPLEPITPTPLYDRAKRGASRAERALASIEEVLILMEHPMVVWKLKGKKARGGVRLVAEDAFAPPELSARLGYSELQALRLRLVNVLRAPLEGGDMLNQVPFSVEEPMNVLHAIRREAVAHLRHAAYDDTFLELKNLCQLALGNLQQMSFVRPRALA